MPKISSLDHLVITAEDLQATLDFYTEALGMAHQPFAVADGTTRHALAFGAQKINLHEAGSEFLPHAAKPGPGTADLCFLSEMPIAEWQAHLAALNIEIEEGPVARTGAQSPLLSIYLRDPDGNLIEISNSQ